MEVEAASSKDIRAAKCRLEMTTDKTISTELVTKR